MPSSSSWTTEAGLQLRSIGILAHLVAVIVLALPTTSGLMNRSAWKEPSVQAEFATWNGHFNAIGFESTPVEFEATLWAVGQSYSALHKTLATPADPYQHWLGTGQGWQMFPAPQRRPAVLHIDILKKGRWEPIYRARSTEHDWNRAFFDQDRIRTLIFLYGWPHMRKRGVFDDFVRHLKPMIKQDFPEVHRARASMWRYTTPLPNEVVPGVPPPGTYETVRNIQLKGP